MNVFASQTYFSVLSVNWFIFLVIGGGLITAAQLTAFGRALPVELVIRMLLALQLMALIFTGKTLRNSLPAFTTYSILFLWCSGLITFFATIPTAADIEVALRAHYFMFNIGFFLIFLVMCPVNYIPGTLTKILFAVLFIFGALQVIKQDLLLSPSFREEFGIQFEHFVNGKVRVSSFFNSKTKFGEFTALVVLVCLYKILSQSSKLFFWVPLMMISMWLISNTFSRSGYVLLISSIFCLIFILWGNISLRKKMLLLFMAGFVIPSLGLLLTNSNSSNLDFTFSFMDTTSLDARFDHWKNAVMRYNSGAFDELLFGSGEAAMFSRSEIDYFAIDNILLVFLAYGGITALFGFIWMYLGVLYVALQYLKKYRIYDIVPVIAFYIGLFFEGFTADNHNTIFLTQFALIAIIGPFRLKESQRNIFATKSSKLKYG